MFSNETKIVNVRTVLHDEENWEKFIKDDDSIIIEDNQRYIRIRSENGYKEYISTQALHELLIIFRRIEKLYKDSILKSIDLSDLWREILPFGVSGRLLFFSTYFSKSDIESMVFVIYNTVLSCERYGRKNATDYFSERYKDEENCIQMIFERNNRYGLREKFNLRRFKQIVKND